MDDTQDENADTPSFNDDFIEDTDGDEHDTTDEQSNESFTPKEDEDAETPDEHEGFFNTNILGVMSQEGLFFVVLGVSGIAFLGGFIASALFIDGFFCVFEVMQSVLGSVSTGQSSGGGFAEQLRGQFKTCLITGFFTPLPLVSGLLGGVLSALPVYQAAKGIANGKYLRSLI